MKIKMTHINFIKNTISLKKQTLEIVECNECGHKMVNIDADEIYPGDLAILKSQNIRVSNPENDNSICINCENKTFSQKLEDWFEDGTKNYDDSSFFSDSLFKGSTFGAFEGFSGRSIFREF